MTKQINIVIPMAGRGSRFSEAGYSFPKPLIDIQGKTMIEIVVDNLRPKVDHKFIFIVQKEHYEKYDLYNIIKKVTNNKFEIVKIDGITEGAACTVLSAIKHIDNEEEIIIANSDQFIDYPLDNFINKARKHNLDGLIMSFHASHPKWSYARLNKEENVIEVAEKKVISDHATVGIYYFKHGKDFVNAAQSMIYKNIRYNNEFYVCPVYNELILKGKKIKLDEISKDKMHGLGTPEDLNEFLRIISERNIKL